MTKAEAERDFKTQLLPLIETQERPGHKDWPLRRMSWNDYTDSLQKNGQITEHQRTTWTQPAFIRGPQEKHS